MKQHTSNIKAKLFNYFNQRLKLKKSTKGWYRCDCYYCGGNFTFGLNLEKTKAHCFKCGEAKRPLELLMDIENFDKLQDAYKLINLQEEYERYDGHLSTSKVEYETLDLPPSFKILGTGGDSLLGKSALNYVKKRKFNPDKLALKGVGYCTEGDYCGYLVFPIYRKGELIFFQGRKFTGSGPKMRNPPEEDFGIGKTQIIYNADALYIYNRVRLVESITNAETIGDTAIAILGKSISQKQLSEIIGSPCEEIVIILDKDAWDKAIDLAMQLVNYKRVKVVIPPTEQDVNDVGKKVAKEWEKEAKWVTYSELFRMKLNYADTSTSYN